MAFPAYADSVYTAITTATLDPTINIPSPSAGDTFIVIFSSTATHGDPTVPSGWTYLTDAEKPIGDTRSGDRDQIMYRIMDGTEGTTLQIDTSATAVKGHALAIRITGGSTTDAPECTQTTTAGVGTGTDIDPPSRTPGVSKQYLWLGVYLQEGEGGNPSGSPSNYTTNANLMGNTGTGGAVATNAIMAVAYRQLQTESEDPPPWTFPGSDDWAAYTIVVHPQPDARVPRFTPYPQVLAH